MAYLLAGLKEKSQTNTVRVFDDRRDRNNSPNVLWNIRSKIRARSHPMRKRRSNIANFNEGARFRITLAKQKKIKRNGTLRQNYQIALQKTRTDTIGGSREVSRTNLLFAKVSGKMVVLVQAWSPVPVQSRCGRRRTYGMIYRILRTALISNAISIL
jgi:hypothetical protein